MIFCAVDHASEKGMPTLSSCCPLRLKVCKSCEHGFQAKRTVEQIRLTKARNGCECCKRLLKEQLKQAIKLCIDVSKAESTKQA